MQQDVPTAPTEPQEAAEPEDLLSDSLQTLYDYAPITHASAGSVFRYTLRTPAPSSSPSNSPSDPPAPPTDTVITLTTPTTEAHNWSLHASSIWTAALYLADHLDRLRVPPRARVLELGAGAGLPSIALARAHPDARVTASDYPDGALLGALRANVARNGVGARCRVVPHAWGRAVDALYEDMWGPHEAAFDIVLAADTLWDRALHGAFLQTVSGVLKRSAHARVYLVAGLHTGRYTLQAFMGMVGEYGLELVSAVEREVNGTQAREWDVGRAEGEDERERRRWVVDMELKWKSVQ